MSNRHPRTHDHDHDHDHDDPESLAPDEITQDEDLLHASSSAHYHCQSQAIRFRGDLDEEFRTAAQEAFAANDLEAVPIQVTARNRQPEPVRINSEWDGVQLHLDIHPTHEPTLPVRSALGAPVRYYWQRFKLVPMKNVLLLLALVAVAVLVLAVWGLFL